jgi:hypothetical protein
MAATATTSRAIDAKPGVHDVEQGWCVDHVASHGLSLARPA